MTLVNFTKLLKYKIEKEENTPPAYPLPPVKNPNQFHVGCIDKLVKNLQ